MRGVAVAAVENVAADSDTRMSSVLAQDFNVCGSIANIPRTCSMTDCSLALIPQCRCNISQACSGLNVRHTSGVIQSHIVEQFHINHEMTIFAAKSVGSIAMSARFRSDRDT